MAQTLTKSVRIPRDVIVEIEQHFRGRDFSSAANELLDEALKMRRCPGIVFADGPTGRRARISGASIDVWEVVAAHESLGRSWTRLVQAYHWLNETQLRAALGYYECYPADVNARIRANEAWSPGRLRERHPFMRGATDAVLPRRRSQPDNRRHPPKKRRRRD